MFFQKIVALIKEKTNAKHEKVQPSKQSDHNVRGRSDHQPCQSNDGAMCFSTSPLSQCQDQLVSNGITASGASIDSLSSDLGSVALCDEADCLCRGLPSRNYRYCEPKGFTCGLRENGGSLDGCEATVQAPVLKSYKPADVFDVRSRLAVNQPVFQRGCLGFYNPFIPGALNAGDLIRSQLVANEDERRKAKTPDASVEPPSEVKDTARLDELPPIYEDESFGDADDECFVAEDSFQAADGTTVYISQTDDSEELEELEAA